MGKRIYFCKWCASRFNGRNERVKFCSKRCGQEYANYEQREYTAGLKCATPEKYDAERVNRKNMEQADFVMRGREIGLSYGKYRAYISLPVERRERFLECQKEY